MKSLLYLIILLVVAAIYAIIPIINLKAKVQTAFDDEGIQ